MATTGGGYKREEFLLDLSILETASTSNHFVYVTYFVPGLLTTYYLYYSTSFHSWYNLKQNIAFGRPTLRVIQSRALSHIVFSSRSNSPSANGEILAHLYLHPGGGCIHDARASFAHRQVLLLQILRLRQGEGDR